MKRLKALLALVCAGALAGMSGCALAQPERAQKEEDRFVGFHMVLERMPPSIEEIEAHPERYPAEDRSQWTQYGSQPFQVEGVGTLDMPREILIGKYDQESGTYDFPGLAGLNCFLAEEALEGGGTHYTGYNGLADASITAGDRENSLSGTIYFGPPLGDSTWDTDDSDYIWTAYRVFQMADGTVYLDGSGSSFSGPDGFSTTSREESTVTENGEKTTQSMEVTVHMEAVERLESMSVCWYGGENQLLSAQPAALEGDQTLAPPEGAAWAMVEEIDQTGAVTRTSYDLGAPEGTVHQLVLLDDRGLDRVAFLTLEEGEDAL